MISVDFKCNKCNNVFEGDLKTQNNCPKCNSKDIKRIWTPILPIFKCSGFYSKDNSKK